MFSIKKTEDRVQSPSELIFFGQMAHLRQLDFIYSARWCPSKRVAGSAKGQVNTCLSLTTPRAPQALHGLHLEQVLDYISNTQLTFGINRSPLFGISSDTGTIDNSDSIVLTFILTLVQLVYHLTVSYWKLW